VHRKYILIYIHQDAKINSLFKKQPIQFPSLGPPLQSQSRKHRTHTRTHRSNTTSPCMSPHNPPNRHHKNDLIVNVNLTWHLAASLHISNFTPTNQWRIYELQTTPKTSLQDLHEHNGNKPASKSVPTNLRVHKTLNYITIWPQNFHEHDRDPGGISTPQQKSPGQGARPFYLLFRIFNLILIFNLLRFFTFSATLQGYNFMCL
jgi:hypothetical protein